MSNTFPSDICEDCGGPSYSFKQIKTVWLCEDCYKKHSKHFGENWLAPIRITWSQKLTDEQCKFFEDLAK